MRPSNEVLSALAEALRLDPTERRHLFVLHDRPAPERRPAGAERVDEPLRRMLDSLTGQPAFVLGRRWDVRAWNRAAEVVFGPYGRLEGDQRNISHPLFADPDHRRLLVDWGSGGVRLACHVPRRLRTLRRRSGFRAPRRPPNAPDPGVCAAVAAARGGAAIGGPKRIEHPTAGRMLFEYSSFGVG